MENKLAVELTMGHSVIPTYIEDVKLQGLEVSFENNWKPPCLAGFGSVRFPPKEDIDDSLKGFKKKQAVQVLFKDKYSYWHLATLQDFNWNTNRWIVELATPNVKIPDVREVAIDNIRYVNTQPTISQSLLEKVEIEIPAHLRKIAATDGIHEEFRKQVSADTCKYISQMNVLRLITRKGKITRANVNLFKDSHIKYLEREKKRVAPSEEAKFSETFEVEKHLMGLALGKRYANIKEARKIKDVTSVELIEDTLSIQVCGKTAQAVKTARDMLEFREHHFVIPRYLAEEILEDNGKIIKEIVEQSGLVRIESGNDEDDDESEDYPVVFVGNPPCIENAKVLLEYQLKLADRKLKKMQESVPSEDSNLVIERVPMKEELKGLAIGKNYENVKKAEKIPGVVKIETPRKMPMIIIHADNEASAQAARRLLEYDEDTVEVEKQSLGKIIGKGGVTIKKIESLSEGVHIRIPKITPSPFSSGEKVTVTLSGPAHKIPATIELIKRAEFFGTI